MNHSVLRCTGSGSSGQRMVSVLFREKQHRKKRTGALAFQINCATGLVSREQGSAEWEMLLTKGLRSPRAKQARENTAIKTRRNKLPQRQRKDPGPWP